MHNILTLSGWGQLSTSIAHTFPQLPHTSIRTFDYSQYPHIDIALKQLNSYSCDILIGWSLGGQIALRAVAQKIITPKALILLAPPFQFLKSQDIQDGTSSETLNATIHHYQKDPQEMLTAFASLMCLGDSKIKTLLPLLKHQIHPLCPNWLYWLEELAYFSCHSLTFSSIPASYIIHGTNDRVIPFSQTNYFSKYLPNAKIYSLKNCGHTPHLHDPQLLIDTITYVAHS